MGRGAWWATVCGVAELDVTNTHTGKTQSFFLSLLGHKDTEPKLILMKRDILG